MDDTRHYYGPTKHGLVCRKAQGGSFMSSLGTVSWPLPEQPPGRPGEALDSNIGGGSLESTWLEAQGTSRQVEI